MRHFLAPILLACCAAAFAATPDVPDHVATPGALNADVTQATIAQTICNPHWSTRSVRPPASYTTALKRKQLASGPYQSKLPLSAFEEDHLISLEIGGSPTDPANLWPEHYSLPNGAHQKDLIENYLHKLVCAGTLTLRDAQTAIRGDWRTVQVPAPAHKTKRHS